MNIWLEISNSPHINMFSGMLGDLARAHEFIDTARPLANTVQLLRSTSRRSPPTATWTAI